MFISLTVWVLNGWMTLPTIIKCGWIHLLFHHLSLPALFDHTSVELVAILLLMTTSILDHHRPLHIGRIIFTHLLQRMLI